MKSISKKQAAKLSNNKLKKAIVSDIYTIMEYKPVVRRSKRSKKSR